MKFSTMMIKVLSVTLALWSMGGHGASSDLATSPLVTSSTSSVLPNLMFILDDSGSMSWTYMPDWANDSDPVSGSNYTSIDKFFRNSGFNGVAYNPAVTYSPPTKYNSDGSLNTTTYPSQTSANTSTWSAVKNDGYGIQSTSTSNLVGSAYYYTYIPGEYCTEPHLRSCTTQAVANTTNPYPATLRWCSSSAMTSCQANWFSSTYTYPRYPRQATATITVSGTSSTTVSGITVNGAQIMSSATSANTSSASMASEIAARINACFASSSGSCTTSGYSASVSSSTVTINAPATAGNITYTPSVSKTGSMTVTAGAFSGYVSPGVNVRVDIVSGTNSYPYPGSATKASTRSDCAGTTCTYTEEMTNYANWWAYYHTRMQMMKTATSNAFASVGSTYRVGYSSINNNTSSDFLNIGQFSASQKYSWYNKLFAATPNNSTPLRYALSKIGRLYAGKLNGTTFNGSSVTDPMQYSCQQNFSILSTDGYWNGSSGYKLDGSTAIGNEDGAEARPMNDGASSLVTEVTPTTTVTRTQTVTQTTNAKVYRRYSYSLGALGADGCSSTKRKVHKQEQRETDNIVTTTTTVTDTTTGTQRTVVTTNGVQTSDTTSTLTPTSSTVSSNSSTTTNTGSWANYGSYSTSGYSCSSNPSLPSTNPSSSSLISNTTSTTAGPTTTVISSVGPTVGTTTTTTSVSGGVSGSLADVAEYYYGGADGASDLRTSALGNCTGVVVAPAATGNDVCTNNVPSSGQDGASWQHMTTFTLGLGAAGYMQFSPSYLTATSGDFYDIRESIPASSTHCTWQTSGTTCTWPTPSSDAQQNIDDLWHAAVNGRGTYFSATDPASLSAGLSSALAGVSARIGSSAAATTSNPNITSGDNFVFSSTFTTQEWDGELVRQQLDLSTGVTSSTEDWSAQTLLDSNTTRTIYTYDAAAANKLKTFTWASLSTAEKAYFETANISSLSQFCLAGVTCLSAASQTAAAGENLVNFLRGERTNEGVSTDTSKYYRQRTHILGDIVNAEAVYVKTSLFNYADPGYSTFTSSNTSRTGVVYVAANDGMVHAFNSSTGAETWTYIPSLVLSSLYKLADKNYSSLHHFYVDGTPVAGDICVSNCNSAASAVWKTILVGGLNGGGRGYYALDVTDPASPKALWEFTHNNLGYTYGNPKITKLSDGTWAVMFASGYNNVSPGDGQGRLFVLNAATGALVTTVNPTGDIPGTITTGVGSDSATISGICSTAPCPSGLAHIAVRVTDPSTDNSALAVYGGDMYGNLWRFDVNGNVGASGYDAQLIATLRGSSSSNVQPITAKPELGTVNGVKMVYLGTGRYLGSSDLTDTSPQTIYAIKDPLSTTTTPSVAIYTNPRSLSSFVQQTITTTTCPSGAPSTLCSNGQVIKTSSSNSVDLASKNGWYIDLPDSGERANTDPVLALGTLGFTTNVPNTNACTAGGYSYRYFLDYRNGGAISTAVVTVNGTTYRVVSTKLGNALATRPVYVSLPNNTVVELTRLSDGTTLTSNVPIGAGSTATRRVSWRELITE